MKTAEWVSLNHPDKICDRISDAILDEVLRQDPMGRVAIETMGCHGIITVGGEMTTTAFVDVQKIVKSIVGNKYGVQVNIQSQSPDIAKGVDIGGAGDQGIMVGYACNDNEDMIPQELYLARSLGEFIYDKFPYDGKTQITIDKEKVVKTVVASFQNVSREKLLDCVTEWLGNIGLAKVDNIFCNPAGDWNIGGFDADTGLTGRKLMVDNYGPQIPIGGGCFSGKDATKVDRSAAYMARKMAVGYLKLSPECKEVFVKIAYAIGVAKPVMVTIKIVNKDNSIQELPVPTNGIYDLTPNGIIKFLDLRKPQFERLAAKGHFGTGNIWDK